MKIGLDYDGTYTNQYLWNYFIDMCKTRGHEVRARMYNYETEKEYTFTDKGTYDLLRAMKWAEKVTREAQTVGGYIPVDVLLRMPNWQTCSSWSRMAVIDRLIELGFLKLLPNHEPTTWQGRLFSTSRNYDVMHWNQNV